MCVCVCTTNIQNIEGVSVAGLEPATFWFIILYRKLYSVEGLNQEPNSSILAVASRELSTSWFLVCLYLQYLCLLVHFLACDSYRYRRWVLRASLKGPIVSLYKNWDLNLQDSGYWFRPSNITGLS